MKIKEQAIIQLHGLQGNQFVWVPVAQEDFNRYDGYSVGAIEGIIDDCKEPYENGYENEENEYNTMRDSVLEYGGFYVGRYETGTESATERIASSGIGDKAVIKQGKNVYNWIGWSNSDDMNVETGGAVQKSKEFASANNYTSVTSTLIYSVQWDAIMQWIDPEYKNENCNVQTSFVANSTGKGNYVVEDNLGFGTLAKTGSSSDYAVKNIYDLGGNASEWVMESYNEIYRIYRGR